MVVHDVKSDPFHSERLLPTFKSMWIDAEGRIEVVVVDREGNSEEAKGLFMSVSCVRPRRGLVRDRNSESE